MLIGSYHHQLDQKNRFRVPTKFKAFLGENLVITKGSNKCLYLMTAEAMEKNVFEKMQNVSMFDETLQKSFRLLLSSAHEVEFDSQGRALLPAALKAHANITKNVVFVGVGSRVEIWAEEEWIAYTEGVDFDKELGLLAKSGV